MTNTKILAMAVLLAGLPSGSALAASGRTFVASTGADSGVCSRAAPCRSFAYAISQTASAGEVVVLDSAGYGAFAITDSITITNPPGVEAAITAPSGGNAITINAMAPVNVTLRGLTIQGGGVAQNGIAVTSSLPGAATSAGSINIIDCVVKDFTGDGLSFSPSRPTNPGFPPIMQVTLVNDVLLANAGSGLSTSPTSVYLRFAISHLTATSNGTGAQFSGGFGNGSTEFILAESTVALNQTGVSLNGQMSGTIKHSVIKSNALSSPDLANSSSLLLTNNNLIGKVTNNASIQSDGTNAFQSITGNAVTPYTLQ